jgi:hypothetical protein
MRPISVGFPSMKAYMVLWEDTEDEEKFEIKSCKRGKPYVLAYGKKHYLTEDETRFLRGVLRL